MDGGENLRQSILDPEIFPAEFELPGFDFREIQNVIDQLQQMCGALFDVIDESSLLVIELAGFPSARSSEKPTIALSGVRNSWLILARNLLLSRVARSTSRLRNSNCWLLAANLSLNLRFSSSFRFSA